MVDIAEIGHFETNEGARIYQIGVNQFPGLWGWVYLVLVDDYRVLIDTGSGYLDSNQQIEDGLDAVSLMSGVDVRLPKLTHILITHGHIDHFGGLTYIRPKTEAKIGIHELDRRIVTNHAERLSVTSRRVDEFLIEAGASSEQRAHIIQMYKATKSLFRSIAIDFTYEAVNMRVGPFEILHVPGHCAGSVVVRLHDILFSGDHVLDKISPHQAPEQLTQYTGLGHYLSSLDTVRSWAAGVRLTLGGHGLPIENLEVRLAEIRDVHMGRLQKVLNLLRDPHTIVEVSHALFGEVQGYDVLLAVEEAGAHVEYLYQRGLLGIENLNEYENSPGLVPIRYRCIECNLDDPTKTIESTSN